MSENMEQWRHIDGGGALIEKEYIRIKLQHGNPAEVGVNGCAIEDVIEVLIQKILDFQGRKLSCEENKVALFHLSEAQEALVLRRRLRAEQGVIGTNKQHSSMPSENKGEPGETLTFPKFSS
ncbi:MAG: hypothetical protein KF784_04135 [Fimbriimonadaceae bacterium]|nr:hypothetical protein [Fimbriimonadaceae bacterium]